MSYDQETQGSRRNYDDDANYSPSGGAQGIDDESRSGAHGGSGLGQAGGYAGSQGRREGQKTFDNDNNYCETDPGMAGNRGVQDTQDINVPGAGRMGGEQQTDWGQSLGGQGRSRGYERDNDEYDDSGISQGAGAGASRAPKGSMGSKVMGGMEKVAGKVTRQPELEAKGEQRQSGY